MGQGVSADETVWSDPIQEDILRHAKTLTEIAVLSYEDFVRHLGELNRL